MNASISDRNDSPWLAIRLIGIAVFGTIADVATYITCRIADGVPLKQKRTR